MNFSAPQAVSSAHLGVRKTLADIQRDNDRQGINRGLRHLRNVAEVPASIGPNIKGVWSGVTSYLYSFGGAPAALLPGAAASDTRPLIGKEGGFLSSLGNTVAATCLATPSWCGKAVVGGAVAAVAGAGAGFVLGRYLPRAPGGDCPGAQVVPSSPPSTASGTSFDRCLPDDLTLLAELPSGVRSRVAAGERAQASRPKPIDGLRQGSPESERIEEDFEKCVLGDAYKEIESVGSAGPRDEPFLRRSKRKAGGHASADLMRLSKDLVNKLGHGEADLTSIRAAIDAMRSHLASSPAGAVKQAASNLALVRATLLRAIGENDSRMKRDVSVDATNPLTAFRDRLIRRTGGELRKTERKVFDMVVELNRKMLANIG